MKSSAGTRITYYHLARENLTARYPKLFNVLLIMILISMTGLAAFLISDIMSFASDSNHRGILAGFELQDSKKSFMSMMDWNLAGANSSRNESNQSHLKTNSSETSLNSSLMGNTSSSIQTSERFIISSISSNNSNIIAKQESSYTQPRKHHGSGSSAATQNSAKKSNDQQRIKQENNSQTNKTSTKPPSINETATKQTQINETATNKSSIEDEAPTLNVTGDSTELPVKENNSVTPGIMPAISGGNSETATKQTTINETATNKSSIEDEAPTLNVTGDSTELPVKENNSVTLGIMPAISGGNSETATKQTTINETATNKSPIEDEAPTLNVTGDSTELPVKENNSVTPGIMPAISGEDSVTEGQSLTDPAASAQDIIKNVSAIESVAKTKFKTKSTVSLKTGNVPNLDATNISNSIDSKTVSRTGAPSVPGSLQNNLAGGDNKTTQISISKDPKTDANSLDQRKKNEASKESSSSIASPSKAQKLKDARALQMVNRNKIAEGKKKK